MLNYIIIINLFFIACSEPNFKSKIHTPQQDAKLDEANPNVDSSKREEEDKPNADSSKKEDITSNDLINSSPDKGEASESEIGAPVIIGQTQAVPQFALLANSFQCSACHLKVKGDLISTRSVALAGEDMSIYGDWIGAEKIEINFQSDVEHYGTIYENYTGPRLPPDFNMDGRADFPVLASSLDDYASGSLNTLGQSINGKVVGPVTLFGSKDNPIAIMGQVVIDGDVAISGFVKGVGTLYATGDIYILNNIELIESPFPYPEDDESAEKQARKWLEDKNEQHALALASKGSIFVGEPDQALRMDKSAVEGKLVKSTAGIWAWYPGGTTALQNKLNIIECTSRNNVPEVIVDKIESFLYAQNGIFGLVAGSVSINGGIMTDRFHILGKQASSCSGEQAVSAEQKQSQIQYDFRLRQGLNILQALSKYFPNQ